MKVEIKGNSVILKDTQSNCDMFIQKIEHEYNSFKNQNLILDVSHNKNFILKDLKLFDEIIKNQKKQKKSIIIVVNDIDFNSVPQKYIVVPSSQEAHDIIEMDEIERDLGF
jgi:hypothetical protein